MNGDDRRRRAVTAQAFAAVALFIFAHAARAATVPPQATLPAHGATVVQVAHSCE